MDEDRRPLTRTFPAPWRALEMEECFKIVDGTGEAVAYVYYDDRPLVGTGARRLTRDEARRIAVNIAKLPELLKRA